jgi:hypothetical protein
MAHGFRQDCVVGKYLVIREGGCGNPICGGNTQDMVRGKGIEWNENKIEEPGQGKG